MPRPRRRIATNQEIHELVDQLGVGEPEEVANGVRLDPAGG